MTITGAGDVGIGTDDPETTLHVGTGVDSTLTAGGYFMAGLKSGANILLDNNEIMARNNSTASELYLNADGGLVSVGKFTDVAELQLGGAGHTNLNMTRSATNKENLIRYRNSGGDEWVVGLDNSPAAYTSDFQIKTTNNGAPDFGIRTNGEVYCQEGEWSAYSDARLKEDVEGLSDSLETLLALRGVSFKYINPKALGVREGERLGFIAQEVEQVLPNWVNSDGEYKTLTIQGFEALAVEALRELSDENDKLEAANAELEQRLAELEAEQTLMREQFAAFMAER